MSVLNYLVNLKSESFIEFDTSYWRYWVLYERLNNEILIIVVDRWVVNPSQEVENEVDDSPTLVNEFGDDEESVVYCVIGENFNDFNDLSQNSVDIFFLVEIGKVQKKTYHFEKQNNETS